MTEGRIQWLHRLRDALLDAFPERSDLEQQLWFQLGVRLDEIAADSANLTDTVFELLKWSEAHGRTKDLAQALVEARPDRDDLKQLLNEWPGTGSADLARPAPSLGAGQSQAPQPEVARSVWPWPSTARARAVIVLCGAVLGLVVLVAAFLLRSPKGSDTAHQNPATPTAPAAVSPASSGQPTASQAGGETRLTAEEIAAVRRLMAKEPERFRVDEHSGARVTFWPNGSTITVAFLDGTPELKALVKEQSAEWTKYANVHFVFVGNPDDSEVRVTFTGPSAYSHLGTDALGVDKAEPTAVLGLLKDANRDERAYTVLHEFGHVLGLIHEFQNPNAKALVNWDVVYEKAAQPPNLWSRETVDETLRPPKDVPPVYINKPFDPQSVMLSNLPDDWLVSGAHINPGPRLSAGDKEFIALVYPR